MAAASSIIAIAALTMAAASSVVSYTQQERAAKKQEEAARSAAAKEAELLAQQAADEEERGREEADKIRENAKRIKAAQEAGLGGAGVKIGEGTASDILFETDKLSELDALAALKDSTARANLLKKRGGNLLSTDYSVPRTSSLLSTGLSIGSSALNAYGKYKGEQNKLAEKKASNNLLYGDSYD